MGVAGLVAGGPTHVAGSTGLHGYPVASNPLPDLTLSKLSNSWHKPETLLSYEWCLRPLEIHPKAGDQ